MVVTPPSAGGPFDSYELELCPTNPAAPCFIHSCTPTATYPAAFTCKVDGLNPSTTYSVTAVAIKGTDWRSLPSNMPSFTTPSAPVLTEAEAYGPTTGMVTATPPPGVTCDYWTFTAVSTANSAVTCNAPATGTSPDPEGRFYCLVANTQVPWMPARGG